MSSRLVIPILAALLVARLGALAPAQNITLRPGYVSSVWFNGLATPTAMDFDEHGRLYALTMQGAVLVLDDVDRDGVIGPGDLNQVYYNGVGVFGTPCTGLEYHAGSVYVSHQGVITRLTDMDDDQIADVSADIVTNLPVGSHQNNDIEFDDAGRMFFGLGSTTDHDPEPDIRSATVMVANADGTGARVWAYGIRNAFGLVYHPGLGLFASENAPNGLAGTPNPFDEINRLEKGRHYGFPFHYGNPPAGTGTEAPAFVLPPHAAPGDMDFDFDRQWSGFDNEMYVALIAQGAGALVQIGFHKRRDGGLDGLFFPLAAGFTNVIDVKFSPRGELMALDFATGEIHRIVPADKGRIRLYGSPRVGEAVTVELDATPEFGGDLYAVALSTANSPAASLNQGRLLHLDILSPVFAYTITPGNLINVFPIPGLLDAEGRARGTFFFPYNPALVGAELHAAFVSFNFDVKVGVSTAPVPFKVLPRF